MTAIAPSYEDQASAFAVAVRSSLADLPEAELDELLDGLEADLVERLADGGELGDADAYADELRNAAGLPARDAAGGGAPKAKKNLRDSLRDTRISLATRIRTFWGATPARRSLGELLASLAPVWWVMRGVVVAWFVLWWFGHPLVSGLPLSPIAFTRTLALVVVSVQWGRGKWAPKRWLVVSRKLVSVAAVILLLPFVGIVWNSVSSPNYVYVDEYPHQGIVNQGEQVTNVFAFDCLGQPIEAVQLFDQNGNPILIQPDADLDALGGLDSLHGWDEERQQNIRYDRNGLAAYAGLENVFPLQEARAATDRNPHSVKTQDATWPIDSTLPLSPNCPVPTSGEETSETAAAVDEGADAADRAAAGDQVGAAGEGADAGDQSRAAGEGAASPGGAMSIENTVRP